MAVRDRLSSLAHAHLNTLAELLHKHPPARALARFSKHIAEQPLDAVSANAVHFVTHAVPDARAKEELLARVHHAKRQIDTCAQHLAELAAQKLRDRTIVVHPLGTLTAPLVKDAKRIRFLHVNQAILHSLSLLKLEAHQPITAANALENADLVLLEPHAITPEGIAVQQGGRLLAELADARGIPVYAAATSWHAIPGWSHSRSDERVPARFLTGIISEHGIYAHDQFLARVQKTFPWIF